MELISWIASLVLIAAYLLLSTGKISQTDWKYHSMNLFGSTVFIFFSIYKHANSAIFINVIFACIALYSIIKILFKK